MQIYKYMDIGTAKPTEVEKQGIRHYLIDEVCPDEEFSVVMYQEKAMVYIKRILGRGKGNSYRRNRFIHRFPGRQHTVPGSKTG